MKNIGRIIRNELRVKKRLLRNCYSSNLPSRTEGSSKDRGKRTWNMEHV